jgi:GT2 family glycosyltransferase/glycosyltransferase involved in cell wall biosynthesis
MNPNSLTAYTTNTWVSPLAWLRILGPAQQAGLRVIRGNDGEKIYPERVSAGEVVLIQRDFPRFGKAYEEIVSRARAAGCPVVYDLDDLLLELPEEHPDRLIHYYSSALLPMLRAIIEADAVTASTQPLCDYLRPFNPNVYLLPNYLNDSIWQLRTPQPSKNAGEPVVIGYMGGESHAADLGAISPALVNIAQRFEGKVAFRFLGAKPTGDLIDHLAVRWDPAPTFVYRQFAQEFLSEDYDICIAPLKDNLFNRCKSPIKYLEYTALGAPGVYSRISPYAEVINHGDNGWLASSQDEWEEYLAQLIENPQMRFEMAANAQEDVRARWLLSDHASEWIEAYSQAATIIGSRDKFGGIPVEIVSRLARQTQDYYRQLQSQLESLQTRLDQLADQKHNLDELTAQLKKAQGERDLFSRQLWALQHRDQSRYKGLLSKASEQIAHPSRLPGAIRRSAGRSLEAIKSMWAKPRPTKTSPAQSGLKPPHPARPDFAGWQKGLHKISEGAPAQDRRSPTKLDVITFAIMDWETRTQRPQQLAMQFADHDHRIFYIQTAFVNQPELAYQQVYPNIFTVYLPSPEALNPYREAMGANTLDVFHKAVRELGEAFQITNAVSKVDLPFWTPLAMQLRQELGWKVVYDCMDQHAGFATNASSMLDQEEALSAQSDLIFVTSHLLMQEKSARNPNCLLAPNGADYDHFSLPALGKPEEIRLIPPPIIGYYGAIADWFDSKLIAELAKARPDWNFVLIGSTLYADLAPLQGSPNVHLIGEAPYPQLPAYLQAFDAAIIPFKKTPLTQATNPVKLFEYLSAGKPVVATDLDELSHYHEYLRLASSPREWVQGIEAALKEDKEAQVETRQMFARQNTWEHRYREMETNMKSLYPKASIIILTYNNLQYTRLCLESIYSKTDYPNYEIIVVDNASTDETPEFLENLARDHENVELILNQANAGFAAGNNQGAEASSGDFLVFLNNDTVVTRGWLSRLIHHLGDMDVGMVGPVTNWSGNESRIEVDYLTLQGMDDFARRYTTNHDGQRFEIKMLPLMCAALRRPVFKEVGALDEAFGVGMFEDDDYALRLKSSGYKIICAEDVFVHHWGSASFSKIKQDKYQRLFNENRRKFEAKWGLSWEQHKSRE